MGQDSKQPEDSPRESKTAEWEEVPNREVVAGTQPTVPVPAGGRGSAPAAQEPEDGIAEAEVSEPVNVPATTGLSVGMWVSLVVGAVVLVLLLVFILQNNVSTEIHFFGWHFSLPLGVSLLLSAVGGLLIAGVVGSIRILQLSHRLRKVGRALK